MVVALKRRCHPRFADVGLLLSAKSTPSCLGSLHANHVISAGVRTVNLDGTVHSRRRRWLVAVVAKISAEQYLFPMAFPRINLLVDGMKIGDLQN